MVLNRKGSPEENNFRWLVIGWLAKAGINKNTVTDNKCILIQSRLFDRDTILNTKKGERKTGTRKKNQKKKAARESEEES